MGSNQPREGNRVTNWLRSSEIRFIKLKLKLRDDALLTTRPPATPSTRNCFSRSSFFWAVMPRIYVFLFLKFDSGFNSVRLFFLKSLKNVNCYEGLWCNMCVTERGGSVVTHETRIREVPGSNPGADRPDWGCFVVFLNHQGKYWVGFSLPRSILPLFIKFLYHKINSVNLTIETLTTHNNRNTQPSGIHTKGPRRDMTKMLKRL